MTRILVTPPPTVLHRDGLPGRADEPGLGREKYYNGEYARDCYIDLVEPADLHRVQVFVARDCQRYLDRASPTLVPAVRSHCGSELE